MDENRGVPNDGSISSRTKRPHTKSRKGCLTCKQKRVKCDETRPICVRCKLRGHDCVYMDPQPLKRVRKVRTEKIDIIGDDPEVVQYITDDFKGEELCNNDSNNIGKIEFNTFGPSHEMITDGTNFGIDRTSLDDYQIANDPNAALLDVLFDNSPALDLKNNAQGVAQQNELGTVDQDHHYQHKQNAIRLAEDTRRSDTFYMNAITMNNRLGRYHTEVYYKKISPVREDYASGWQAIVMLGHVKESVYHMLLADLLIDLYHMKLSTGKENVLNLDEANDYLMFANTHYAEYQKLHVDVDQISENPDVSKFDLLAYFSSSLLKLIYHLISPTMSIFDADFYLQASNTVEAFIGSVDKDFYFQKLQMSTVAELGYYSPHSMPSSSASHIPEIFFPNYLYSLTEMNSGHTRKLPANHGSKYSKSYVHLISQEQQLLISVIDRLKTEYNVVFTEEHPERDALRIFLRFIMSLHADFVDMILDQEPRALIIMAHYLMLLASLDFNTLFPKKCIELEFQNLYSVLESKWQPWVNVPKTVILGTDSP